MKNIENKIFITLIGIIMLGGLIKPLVLEREVNYFENRPAYLMPKVTLNSYIDKTFQDDFEKAISDQIPLSNKMKIVEKSMGVLTDLVYSKIVKNELININGTLLKDGYLLYNPRYLDSSLEYLDKKVENINKALKENPKIDFYLYYIEKDTDIDFSTNNKMNLYEHISSKLDKNITSSKFEISNFDEFKEYFYKTDHHWNYKGSYKAYTELAKLFNVSPINYKEEVCFDIKWSGSKSSGIGGNLVFKEDFCAYKFDFPEHTTYINNSIVNEYGNTQDYFNKSMASIGYGSFYGGDNGLVEFDYDNQKENLLILGESYDNAINELLSIHFNKTYNVDLRAYESDIGKEFKFQEFLKEYDIDKVLLIGNIDYFVLETFMLNN